MLLAIDPGMNSPGIAVFCESGLVHASRVEIPAEYASRDDGERWLRVAEVIVCHIRVYTVDTVIFERPQWYAKAKSKGDPNQLAGVAGVAACTVGILSTLDLDRRTSIDVFSPTPAEWVGQLSKVCPHCNGAKGRGRGKARVLCPECKGSDWETPRGRRIRSRLSPAELALVPDQNDAIDAVGLGLFHLGRLTPRSVLSNGRDGR